MREGVFFDDFYERFRAESASRDVAGGIVERTLNQRDESRYPVQRAEREGGGEQVDVTVERRGGEVSCYRI